MKKENNPNLPPNTVTLDRYNLDKKLLVDASMPWYAYLIVLYFGGVVAFALLASFFKVSYLNLKAENLLFIRGFL